MAHRVVVANDVVMESSVTTARRWAWPALRFVAGVVGALALGYGAALLLLLGTVAYSDCLFHCGGNPDHVAGVLLVTAGVASAAAGVTSVVFGFGGSRRILFRVFPAAFVVLGGWVAFMWIAG